VTDMEPQMNADECRLDEITSKIIACAYAVANGPGAGFLEKVCENALFLELTREGVRAKQQWPIVVQWRDAVVGQYVADLLVEDEVLVELKCCDAFDDVHIAQCLNYLKATNLKVCLLINFQKPKIQIKRIVNKL
jgi:GxxExxY protein